MNLNDRMKRYEKTSRSKLVDRMPYIIRIDGRHFHSFTEGLETPFSVRLSFCMEQMAKGVCEEVSGAQLAYIQSDEVSILITPYTSQNFDPFLDNRVQKLSSICASIATKEFNQHWTVNEKRAMFDCRVFNVPKDDVENYYLHRQLDWIRNSVQMMGREYYSHQELHGLTNEQVKDKLITEQDVYWNELLPWESHGVSLRKETVREVVDHPEAPDEPVERNKWKSYRGMIVDFNKDRDFVRDKVFV